MTKKHLRIMLLLAVLGVNLYFYLNVKPAEIISAITQDKLDPSLPQSSNAKPATAAAATSNSLRNLRAHLRDDAQLRPDRRFILALSELRKLAGMGEQKEPQMEFIDDHWTIRWETGNALTMPMLPDFPSAMAVLGKYAQEILPQLNVAPQVASNDEELPAVYQPTLLWEQLRQAEAEWLKSNHTATSLVNASKILARLSYVSIDRLEVSDHVQAKALALLVLAQAASGDPLLEAESQNASRMSYDSHALQLAAKLPETNLWRLYIERKDDALAKAHSAIPYKQKDTYLLLRRLAENNDIKAWMNTIRRQEIPPEDMFHLLATSFSTNDFYPRNVISNNLHYLILSHLMKNNGAMPGVTPPPRIQANIFEAKTYLLLVNYFDSANQKLLENFESWLNTLSAQNDGPILDAGLYRSFYQGYFYTALHHYANHLLNSYSSVEAAKNFMQIFSQVDQGIGKEFKVWFGHLVNAEEENKGGSDLLADLQGFSYLGVAAWWETWDAYLKYIPFGSPEAAKATQLLVPRLDSRIDHRYLLANLLRSTRLDLAGAETIYASIIRDDPEGNRNLQIWLAKYEGEEKRLLEFARNKTWLARHRVDALSSIDSSKDNQAVLDASYSNLLTDHPDSWQAVHEYANFLEKNKNYPKQIEILDDWLKHNKNAFELRKLSILVSIADSWLQQGKPELAWDIVKDSLDSMYGSILSEAVKIRVTLSDYELAEELAQTALKRYTSSLSSLLDLVDVYWVSGRYDKAAQSLKTWPLPIIEIDWRWKIGARFVERFAAKPAQETEAAFAELFKAGIDPYKLQGLPMALNIKGQNEAAFLTQTQLRVQGMGYTQMLVYAFTYLKDWKGQAMAATWLDKQIPPQARNFMSMLYMLQKQTYPLLWSMIPNPESGQFPEAVWLYRAAAKIDGAVLTSEQNKALDDYYASNPTDFYGQLGLYVLGRLDAAPLLDTNLTNAQICEAAYYFGLRAESEKKYNDAAEWYLTAVRTQLFQSGEYRWSYERLYKWHNISKSLKYIATLPR